jgi:multiple sugar transport system permease protein
MTAAAGRESKLMVGKKPNIRPLRRRPRRSRLAVVNTAVLVVAALYFLFPLVWLFTSSTKSQGALFQNPGLSIGSDFFSNIATLFTEQGGIYTRWLLNGLGYAGIGALIGTLLAAMAGYAFAKFEFFGKRSLFGLVLVGVLIPPTVLALPLFLMLSAGGLANTYWSVLLPSIASPFGVYVARIYSAAAIPDQLLEAARLDGASDLRIFRAVSLRLMWPGLVTLFLFQFAAIWNNFLLPLIMLTNSDLYPATLGLYIWNSTFTTHPEILQSVVTGSLVAVLPVIVLFVSLERFMRSGLAAGSVKE